MTVLTTPSNAQTGWLFPLVTDMINQIFVGEARRLSRLEASLVEENSRLGSQADWFQFQGRVYSKGPATHRIAGQSPRLDPKLYAAASEHAKDLAQIETDKRWVQQALVLLLRDCTSLQDLVDALPNSLHATLAAVREGAKGLKRSREEAWSLRDNPRAMAQYEKLREKMEFYNISNLVY